MYDWIIRAVKTFVAVFLGVLIPEITAYLAGGFPADYPTLWLALNPTIAAGLAASISALWNLIQELLDVPKSGDWQERTLKTFAQAFLSVFIPGLVLMLNGGFPASWGAAWQILAPTAATALATAITATWNILLEKINEE